MCVMGTSIFLYGEECGIFKLSCGVVVILVVVPMAGASYSPAISIFMTKKGKKCLKPGNLFFFLVRVLYNFSVNNDILLYREY